MSTVSRIEDFAEPFDPFSALLTIGGEGHIVDPLLELGRLRRISPVVEGDLHEHFGAPRQVTLGDIKRSFMVLGFKQCNELLLNPTDFSNQIYETNVGITFGKSITAMDAPFHGKYRRLFQAAFTPKMLDSLRAKFEVVIDKVIGAFQGKGEADLVHDLALRFPFHFICDLMDLPVEDRPTFHKLAAGQTCVVFDRAHGVEASDKLGRYLEDLIAERAALKSESDFVSIIANAQVDGERLPKDVLLGFFRQLMNAGGDTSYHGFSNILAALFTSQSQLDAIRKDRSLIPQAIEEGLRWGAPITAMDRMTANDVVLAGVEMPKHSAVRVCIAVANRDDSIWPNPDEFDIFREHRRAMPFGYGAHVCIGQHLARMELQVALNALLDRLPNVRLDKSKPAPVIRGLTFRGADAVHVKWD